MARKKPSGPAPDEAAFRAAYAALAAEGTLNFPEDEASRRRAYAEWVAAGSPADVDDWLTTWVNAPTPAMAAMLDRAMGRRWRPEEQP